MQNQKARGQVLGRAGGGLSAGHLRGADRGAVAQGLQGERRTAKVLDALAKQGFVVMHDLNVPAKDSRGGNVDHLLAWSENGKQVVVLLDSKQWRGGWFYRLGSKAYRNGRRFQVKKVVNGKEIVDYPGDKRTLPWARRAYATHLVKRFGSNVDVRTSLLVVWPSQKGKQARVSLLSSGGVKAISGDRLADQFPGSVEPADPRLIEVLRPLLMTTNTTTTNGWF